MGTTKETDEELALRRDQLALDVRHDPELREDLREAEDEIARRTRAGKAGGMGTVERVVRRDVRDAELDARADAEHAGTHLRGLLTELRGLRMDLIRRARLLGDPTRFDDDREAVEDFITGEVRHALRGEYSGAARIEEIVADRALVGTEPRDA
jgi:hypothetical protein